MPIDSRPILAICDEIAARRMTMPADVSMPMLKAQTAIARVRTVAQRDRTQLIHAAAYLIAAIQRLDESELSDGFNPHGSGPVEIGMRPNAVDVVFDSPPCHHRPQRFDARGLASWLRGI